VPLPPAHYSKKYKNLERDKLNFINFRQLFQYIYHGKENEEILQISPKFGEMTFIFLEIEKSTY